MTKLKEIYKCESCGNMVEVLHESDKGLGCCNQEMVPQKEHTEDPEKGEKHIPIIEGKKVKVGAVEHPMTEEHYIEWIEARNETGKTCKVLLNPGDKPEAEFCFEVEQARIYCNIHGLWISS